MCVCVCVCVRVRVRVRPHTQAVIGKPWVLCAVKCVMHTAHVLSLQEACQDTNCLTTHWHCMQRRIYKQKPTGPFQAQRRGAYSDLCSRFGLHLSHWRRTCANIVLRIQEGPLY